MKQAKFIEPCLDLKFNYFIKMKTSKIKTEMREPLTVSELKETEL